MIGPKSIPGLLDLAAAYEELQSARHSLHEDRLATLAVWSRFDPRLFEQLVQHFKRHWRSISPVRLNLTIRDQSWPASLGPVLEHMLLEAQDAPQYIDLLKNWKACCLTGIQPAANELFYVCVFPLAGKFALREVLYSSELFGRWGFFGTLPTRKDLQPRKKRSGAALRPLSIVARENLARDLAAKNVRFSISDYLEQCQYSISRRQAERDLNSFSFLQASGNTRARCYQRRG